jgi:hypothetical protein
VLSYFVNPFLYIRYKALSNSSHVNNSASTFSPSIRHVFTAVQVSTVVQVVTSTQVHATAQEATSFHVHTISQVDTSVQVQASVPVHAVAHVLLWVSPVIG